MSDTDHNDRIRLVPLVAALAGIPHPALDLELVLDLALEGKVQLYASVPPDRVVYVDEALPVTTGRRFSGPWTGITDREETRYTPRSDLILPDVRFLRLDGDLAEDFQRAARWTSAGWASDITFPSGLRPHHDADLAKEGWLEPCQFGAALVVCPTLTTEEVEQWHRVHRKHLRVPLDDVYVDERVRVILKYGYALIPHALSFIYKAEGVYALYRAAQLFYAELKDAPRDIKETPSERVAANSTQNDILKRAKAWIQRKLPKLKKGDAEQVVKLINPAFRRNSGVDEKYKKRFGGVVLDTATFRAKYQQGDFVTDDLAVVLYATNQWVASWDGTLTDGKLLRKRPDLEQCLEELGFYPKEIKALITLIFWPLKNPPATRPPESP